MYLQKKEKFATTIYDLLEELETKLMERQDVAALKMTYFIEGQDTIVKTPSRNKIVIESNDDVSINSHTGEVIIKEVKSVKNRRTEQDSIVIRDTKSHASIFIQKSRGNHSSVIIPGKKDSLEKRTKQSTAMDKLMEKMMAEIIVLDVETENCDSINSLVKRSMNNRGLFMPFEFSLQRTGKEARTLARSRGFDSIAFSYKTDLSGKRILPSHQLLMLQFPDQNDYVIRAMRSSVLLSLFFSLAILSTLYYVMFLIRKQKKLTEIKNDFVNNMTHELKTPLATMSLALDAMAKEQVKKDDERTEMYRRILKEENEKMNQHVERVLQLSVMDRKEQQKRAEVFSVAEVVYRTANNFRLKLEEQNVKLSIENNFDSAEVFGQPDQLELALNNLIDNAFKYSGTGSEIKIIMNRLQSTVTISISDNGPGIEKQHLEKIFEKFYRVQGGDVHDVKGFGLGLSFARQIIFDMNGTLQVKSVVGSGSTFIIQLPLHD